MNRKRSNINEDWLAILEKTKKQYEQYLAYNDIYKLVNKRQEEIKYLVPSFENPSTSGNPITKRGKKNNYGFMG